MRIVHIAASLEPAASGPTYVVPALLKALAAIGCDAELHSVGQYNSSDFEHFRWVKHAADFQFIPLLKQLNFSHSMQQALVSSKLDILHNHGLWRMPNIYDAQPAHYKHVISVHGMLAPYALAYSRWQKKIFGALGQYRSLQNCHMLHATSESEFRSIRAFGLKQPIALIPLGIDVPHPVAKRNDAEKTILYLGRIHPIKRLQDVVLAWGRLAHAHGDWQLRIVGPSEQEEAEKLCQLISDFKIPRVVIEGPVFGAAKEAVFCDADLFVLPSQSENFALSVAEALSYKIPVICSKGAPWQNLETEKCGWWVDIGDDALQLALSAAMALPPQELQEMGMRGRAWMMRDFSLETMATKMLLAYRWLAGKTVKPDFVFVGGEAP
jgi:glycosyltransferase involved in cell wall biosynthesis